MPDALPTVLVADDYPENRRLFTLYLRKAYTVVEAASAEEVLERLVEATASGAAVEVAVLDLNYQGGMTGFDLIAHLRADDRWRDLPTLALTAHASPEDRRACLDAGFDAYLSKPVLKADLLAQIEGLRAAVDAA